MPTTTAPRKRATAKKSTPSKQAKPTVKKTTGNPPTKSTPATKKASASRAARNQDRHLSFKVLGSRQFFEKVRDLSGLDNVAVQDAGDGESFVLVHTAGPLTWTIVPSSGPGSSPAKFDVEVSSANDESMGMPDSHVIGGTTPADVAGELVRLVIGEPKAKSASRPRRTSKPTATSGSMTMKQYDAQVKAIDTSDMDTRHRAAAKAVLTKRAREAGLEVVGSRKPTATMTTDEIAQRRSEAAKRAVATRKANEAAKAAAAKKEAKRPRRRAS